MNPLRLSSSVTAALVLAVGLVLASFTVPHAQSGLTTRPVDPCATLPKTTNNIDINADAVIVSKVANTKVYICKLDLIAAGAENVSVVEGTGTACNSGTTALFGSTTDANGAAFGANGGIASGDGSASVMTGKSLFQDTCLRVNTGGVRIAGTVEFVHR